MSGIFHIRCSGQPILAAFLDNWIFGCPENIRNDGFPNMRCPLVCSTFQFMIIWQRHYN